MKIEPDWRFSVRLAVRSGQRSVNRQVRGNCEDKGQPEAAYIAVQDVGGTIAAMSSMIARPTMSRLAHSSEIRRLGHTRVSTGEQELNLLRSVHYRLTC